MPKQTVFHDKDNEMKCHINKDGKCYIEVGPQNHEDDPYYCGCIILDKLDVKELIKTLKEIDKQME
ncbi:MAG: hypothetical protein IPG78_03655 [Ignavibacteria bacterium]|nr:hypothetical protein [Ignavibacteria bacterium]